MDRIKPVDIERIRFRQVLLRGYDKDEVDELVGRVTSEIETLLKELRETQAENERLTIAAEAARSHEAALRDALCEAQKDQALPSSPKSAELKVVEAGDKAEPLTADLQAKINDLRWELEKLRLEKQKFLARFESMLDEYMQEVKEAQTSEGRKDQPDDPDERSIRIV